MAATNSLFPGGGASPPPLPVRSLETHAADTWEPAPLEPRAYEHAPAPFRARSAVALRGTARPTAAPLELQQPERGGWVRQHLYFLLLLALVPLAINTFQSDPPSMESEVKATVADHPEVVARLTNVHSLEQFLDVVPDHRLHDALLPRTSHLHWIFALFSAALFFGLVLWQFPSARANPWHLLAAGAFTSTVGILLLLSLQYAAAVTQGFTVTGGNILVIIFYIVKFIGFSYRCADDPSNGFWLSFLGFTMGVGLCEEFCKAVPLLIRYKHLDRPGKAPGNNWRNACVWGMASGLGFGIAEGIMYSGTQYNGVASGSIYAVRFLSCVALHAIWAGSVGITLFNRQAILNAADTWYNYLLQVVLTISIAMTLHGLYDTLSKKDMEPWALAVAAASFCWLAFQIEMMRRGDPAVRRVRKSPLLAPV